MKELRDKDGLTEKEFLQKYKPGDYKRPSVTADILVFAPDEDLSDLKLLLIRRGGHPYLGCWALPGGFISENETAYKAAARELEEETGLKDIYLEQIYTFTKPGRDPRTWVMSIAYMALINGMQKVTGLDDASDAAWFDFCFRENELEISNDEKNVHIKYSLTKERFKNGKISYDNYIPKKVSEDGLAFDHVEMIIETVTKLRNRIAYTDLAFNLAGETFTLPDLQVIYELVLGRKLYKKNFRDMIADRVEETGNKIKSLTGKKMSKEYRYEKGEKDE